MGLKGTVCKGPQNLYLVILEDKPSYKRLYRAARVHSVDLVGKGKEPDNLFVRFPAGTVLQESDSILIRKRRPWVTAPPEHVIVGKAAPWVLPFFLAEHKRDFPGYPSKRRNQFDKYDYEKKVYSWQ
jgi:hypothetical protein